ncbi:MAG: glycosyltransferase family 9 protein [Pedobacter sp.]
MTEWAACKKILCVRADNMGDVLMSSPALRALKETFNPSITLLTSSKGAPIAQMVPYVDEVITADLPWVQTDTSYGGRSMLTLIDQVREGHFDGCIIFTVYSQSALPAAMLASLCEIPLVLAYCRENPYQLLSNWVIDKEPYNVITHQVARDLALVNEIGARTSDETLAITDLVKSSVVSDKLSTITGLRFDEYLILHPGVSEEKRRYPLELWIKAGTEIMKTFSLPLLLSGNLEERPLCEEIARGIGEGAFVVAGELSLAEMVALVRHARCLLSVNTGIVHIASAVATPTVVLYARTNPQHKPWKNRYVCLEFSINERLKSRNQVINFVNQSIYSEWVPYPSSLAIVSAVESLLSEKGDDIILAK